MTEKDTLLWQLGVSWGLAWIFLEEVTDAECVSEPSALVWTVRPDDAGAWWADFSQPEPDPCPLPTIAWLTWHIGWWWSDAYGRCFGSGGGLLPQEVAWPGSAQATRLWLTTCHDQWRASLAGADLDSIIDSADGWPLSGRRLGQIAGWANVELMKNAAEIGYARRLLATSSRP